MSWDWDALKKQQQEKRNQAIKDSMPAWQKKPFWKKLIPKWNMKEVIKGILIGIVLICLIVVVFLSARWLHYKVGYQEKVRQEIIEMVKPEALKDQYRKE